MSLRAFGTRYIVLNSFKVTRDLLDKKSGIASNRPHFTVAGDLVGWTNATGFLQYGDTHRKHRKLLGRYMRTNNSLEMFHLAEEVEAKRFVRDLSDGCDDLVAQCRRTTAALILKISHGYSVKGRDDPLVEIADMAMRNI